MLDTRIRWFCRRSVQLYGKGESVPVRAEVKVNDCHALTQDLDCEIGDGCLM